MTARLKVGLSREGREALLLTLERRTELPLLILSILMVPLLLGPLLWDLSAEEDALFVTLDTFIWAAFAVDLGAKLVVAPDRGGYIRGHLLDALVVLVPFLRPLRILRLVLFGSRAFYAARSFATVDFLLVYAIGLVVIGATIVTTVESGADSPIGDFTDAIWWSIVTITTVGYGDVVPVTPEGRAIAIVIMVGGIGIFGGLTANLASYFVRQPQQEETQSLNAEVRALRDEIVQLREELQRRV